MDELIGKFDFTHYGLARLERPLSMDIYKQWIEDGYQGDMTYLALHEAEKENPQKLLPQAKSAIVVAQNYFPHPKPLNSNPLSSLQIALYAQGEDYHYWFKGKLQELANQLKNRFPHESFLAFTDSSPVLERDLAYRAGLGWIGKNSCLIHQKKGSFFFIGEIYSTMELDEVTTPHPDRCGTCQRCIEACPTQALTNNRTMDATKCISYLNIESGPDPQETLRPLMGQWFFGCDICQTVCPWNEKVFGPDLKENDKAKENREDIINDLKWILTSSNKGLLKSLKQSPLTRAGGNGLKRNAIVVAVNSRFKELLPEIQNLLDNDRLRNMVEWAVKELKKT